MAGAISQEITLTFLQQNNEKSATPSIDTLYFGGGTPSLLSREALHTILKGVYRHFQVEAGAEITLEANPDDIHPENLLMWKQMGINRLSIGIQSFRDSDLKWLHRSHNSQRATQAIVLAREAGFTNLSVDLIYGIPGLSDKAWEENIRKVLEFEAVHIACYGLTVEPKTALAHMVQSRKKAPVDPETQARQFTIVMDILDLEGYEHYEISNFAKPGWRSRHNSSYWKGIPYWGFGPSAHSYDGKIRRWNISNNAQYIWAIGEGKIPFEMEELSDKDRLNEYVMTSLRTKEGLDLNFVEAHFSLRERSRILARAQKFISGNKMVSIGQRLQLTQEGKLFADGVASDLFLL